MNASSFFIAYMRDKYAHLLDTIKEVDEHLQILCANTEASNHHTFKDESDLPERIIGINRYFALLTKPHRTGKIIIWATTRLKPEQTLKMSLIIHSFTYNNKTIESQRKDFLYLIQILQGIFYS